MKLRNSFIALLLVGLLFYPGTTFADTTPPTFLGVSMNLPDGSVVYPNDAVIFYVNATDDSPFGMFSYVYLNIVIKHTNGTYQIPTYAYYNSSKLQFVSILNVENFWPSGTLYISSIDIYDESFNWKGVYNGTDYNSPTLQVNGTDYDYKPPELVSINSNVASGSTVGPNTSVILSAYLNDSQSGVSYAEVSIYHTDGNLSTYVSAISLSAVNETVGTSLEFTGSFIVGQYWDQGRYDIRLYVFDSASNFQYYSNLSAFFYFYVANTTVDNIPPALHSVAFNSTSYKLGSYGAVLINITDDISGFSYGFADIVKWNNSLRTWEYATTAFASINSPTLAGIIEFVFYIDSFWLNENDRIAVNFIYLGDVADNYAGYANGSDFISPNADIIQSPTDSPPTLFGVFASEVANNSLTFSANITDDSPIDKVEMVVEHRLDNNDVISSSYIAQLNSTSGLYEVHVPVTPPPPASNAFTIQKATQVNVSLMKILVKDSNGIIHEFTNGFNFTLNPLAFEVVIPEIIVNITPVNGTSYVGDKVNYTISIKTTFMHDMPNVTFELIGKLPNAEYLFYMENFTLYANTSIIFTVTVEFLVAGSFSVIGTLYDDIGRPWSFEVHRDVLENTDSTLIDITAPQNNETTSETTSDSNTSQLIEPTLELPLPGFEIFVSFASILVATIVIRRKKAL